MNPTLYSRPTLAAVDITQGNNGAFTATAGWDAASGLGRLAFPTLLTLLGIGGTSGTTGTSGGAAGSSREDAKPC